MVLVVSPTESSSPTDDRVSCFARSGCNSVLETANDSATTRETVLLPRASLASVRSWRATLGLRDALRHDDNSVSQSTSIEANQYEDDVDTEDADGGSRIFPAARIRVWKQAVPAWMNLYLPRFVRLQSGPRPYLEYTRHKTSHVRQRVFLTNATRVVREPKDTLLIEFAPTATSDKGKDRDVASQSSNKTKSKAKGNSKNNQEEDAMTPRCEQWRLRFETKKERDVWCKKIQDAIDLRAWIGKYKLGDVLIETETASLVECFSWLDDDKPSYVMKVINATKQSARSVRNELRLHHALTNFTSHPNILTLHDAFRSSERACLVVDYCAGGDLFECLRADGRMEEAAAKTLFRFIVQAIAYIHEHKIVHLDIKPENLLFKSPRNLRSIKIADFGSAQSLSGTRAVRQVSYTVGYAAPEVLQSSEISFAADVFSAGAVLYTILCGHGPFQSADRELTLAKNVKAEFVQDELVWGSLSAPARELVGGMLQADPAKRLTMAQVLDHPWLRGSRD